jgi:hypothetical protein
MTGELLINTLDAYTTYGASIGDGFIGAILEPAPQKEYIENDSRLQNGKKVVVDSNLPPKVDERTVTLVFGIEGISTTDFLTKLKAFYAALGNGQFTVNVPALGSDNYKLYFQKSTEFSMNVQRTFCKISAQFIEPNPVDRT